VPAIAISPWLSKGVDSLTYEHSSVPSTVKNLLNLSSDYLTARDREARDFVTVEEFLEEKRTDCPEKLPWVAPAVEMMQ